MSFTPSQPLAWWIYSFVMAFYSVIEFGLSQSGERPPIFSERNAVQPSSVIRTHMLFLAILLIIMLLATYSYPLLPAWFIYSTNNRSTSCFVILLLMSIIALGYFERKLIYVDSTVLDPENEEDAYDDYDAEDKHS